MPATASESSPSRFLESTRLSNAVIFLLAAAIVTYSLFIFLFLPRSSDIDELGLFNPIYMKVHYGRMTYPIYGHFNAMFVHPPVRYSEIALLMKLGFTLPYAEGFMVFLLTSLIAVVVACARFNSPTKLGLMFGFFATLVWMSSIDERTYGLRPDTQVALAWFLGLVLLQDGMARDWELKRLFMGAFVITYASGLHYYAAPAFLGTLAFLFYANKRLPSVRFRRVAASILAGGCLFGAPYILLFVFPELWSILQFTAQVQQAGSWFSPIQKHFEQYRWWLNTGGHPVYYILWPALVTKAPMFFAGAALLFLQKDTRCLAVAGFPLCMFVLVYSQGKSAGYFLPELIIYLAGMGLLVAVGLEYLAGRIYPRFKMASAAIAFAMLMCWATFIENARLRTLTPSPHPLTADMDIARASAKEIVGNNALIGGRLGLWYISGASHWYDVEPDLLWQNDISGINLSRYFRSFDYVVEHDHMSYTTVNSRLESLPSWYASRLLRLRGFFFADRQDHLSFLIFDTGRASSITGFIWENSRLRKFTQNVEGRYAFLSCLCPFESWPPGNRFQLPHFNAIYLPKASPQDPKRSFLTAARPGDPQSAVVTSVLSRDQLEARRAALFGACKELDTVWGNLDDVNAATILRRQRDQDTPIRFFRKLDDAVVSRLDANGMSKEGMDLSGLRPVHAKASISGNGTKTVSTPGVRWSYTASIPITFRDRPQTSAWLYVRAKVVTGQIGFGVLDPNGGAFLTRRFVDRQEEFETIYLPLTTSNGTNVLMIENGDRPTSSQVVVEDIGVIVKKDAATPAEMSGRPREPATASRP